MMKIKGNWITLKGITGHGRNRIREHGDLWEILDLPIKSLKTGEWRWLDDINFEFCLESMA